MSTLFQKNSEIQCPIKFQCHIKYLDSISKAVGNHQSLLRYKMATMACFRTLKHRERENNGLKAGRII